MTSEYIDKALFEKECEFKVFDFIKKLEKLRSSNDFTYKNLLNLIEINTSILNDLFEQEIGILVMAEDLSIRNNRLNLLGLVRNYSLLIGDFTILNS